MSTIGESVVLLVHDAIEIHPPMSETTFECAMDIGYPYLEDLGCFKEVRFHMKDKRASLEAVEAEINEIVKRHQLEEKGEVVSVQPDEEDGIPVEREEVASVAASASSGVILASAYGIGDSLCSNPSYLAMKQKFDVDRGLVKVLNPLSYFYLKSSIDGKSEYCRLTREQLLHTFENSRIRLPKRSESFAAIWLKDPSVRTYDRCGVYPIAEDVPPNSLNLFKGFAVSNFEISDTDRQDPRLLELRDAYFSHLRYLVDDEDHVQYWLKFLGHMFQFPKTKPRVCLVLQSYNEGVGKGLFEQVIRKILGETYSWYTASPEDQLFGNFNGLVEGKFFGVIDENQVLKKEAVEKCKSLITNPDIVIRRMNTDSYMVPDYNRIIVTTNSSQPVSVGQSDRRFVISSTRNPILDQEHTTQLISALNDKRVLRLIYEMLMNVEVTEDYPFDKCRPSSKAYDEIKEMSTPFELRFFPEWFVEICATGLSSECASASFFRGGATSCSSSSSTHIPSTTSGDKFFNVDVGEFHKAYVEYMQKSHLEHHLSCQKFTSEMLRHFDVQRGVVANANGIAYFKVVSRASPFYQKMVWSFSKRLVLEWLVGKKFVTADDIKEL
jgi:hypothetical protein